MNPKFWMDAEMRAICSGEWVLGFLGYALMSLVGQSQTVMFFVALSPAADFFIFSKPIEGLVYLVRMRAYARGMERYISRGLWSSVWRLLRLEGLR